MKTAENASFWTPERTKQAADLYSAGSSALQVAKVLGTTRNAVIGKMHREGVLGTNRPNKRGEVAAIPRQRASAPRAIKAPSAAASIRPVKANLAPKLPAPERAQRPMLAEVPPTAKRWTERASGECSWPVAGEGADLVMCCAKTHTRWCAEHTAIGCEAPPNTANQMMRSLRRAVG